MNKNNSKTPNKILFLISLLGWFALIGQFYISYNIRVVFGGELIIRYFSYFTIDTNLMVATTGSILFFAPQSKWGNFLNKPATLTAICVYIIVVGLIYNGILRFLWEPKGFQRIVDEILHSVIPILFFIFWILFVQKDKLKWNNVWAWLIYPLAYLVFVLIRGNASDFYPYPFIDINKIGLDQTLINSVAVAGLFAILSLLFIGVGKLKFKRN